MKNILAVTPQDDIKVLLGNMTAQLFSIQYCLRITELEETLRKSRPALVILDAYQNDLLMTELCSSWSQDPSFNHLPIILVGKHADPVRESDAFKAGASDYLYRPLIPEVVEARIMARIKESRSPLALPSDNSSAKRLRLDKDGYSVFLDDQPLELSKKEFELLHLFYEQAGRVLTRREILEKVWKRNNDENDRTIDVHILRLRKKLGQGFIGTQKGVGYRLTL